MICLRMPPHHEALLFQVKQLTAQKDVLVKETGLYQNKASDKDKSAQVNNYFLLDVKYIVRGFKYQNYSKDQTYFLAKFGNECTILARFYVP